MMNVSYQSIQAFVTGFGTFLSSIVRAHLLTIEYRVVQFLPSINILEQFESILVTILLQISFFLFEVVVIDAWRRFFV